MVHGVVIYISIHRTPTDIKTSIYRKPTFTDTIIPYSSNNPTHYLARLLEITMNKGVLSDDWRRATVVSVHKGMIDP